MCICQIDWNETQTLPNTQKFTAVKPANQAQRENNQVNCYKGEYLECIHAISVSYQLTLNSE